MEDTLSQAEAAVAIISIVAGALLIMVITTVVVWQIFATWRARMSIAREEAYRKLAEESAQALDRTAAQLDRHATAIEEVRARTAELERLLKEVG